MLLSNGRSTEINQSALRMNRLRVDGKFLACGSQRVRVRGVTYGPFAPNAQGEPFPTPTRVAEDFAQMGGAGINAIRTYCIPPDWFLHLADENGVAVFLDVPWPKHLCFLDSGQTRREARRTVRQVAERGRNHPCILAYSIGNEIPPDVVRWHGARRVERFLAELRDVVKQADPNGLATYANFPPTEYLDLSSLDFVTFNVYLHDLETFRRYLFRLQNLVGDKPLLLGEIGMDTFRHGEEEQARFLASHVREALLMGLAGTFVFSWTDDWHTGGHQIEDWAFGITRADRQPKTSYYALRDVLQASPAELIRQPPRVSVVVCTYNGGRTLEQCLCSLQALDYPDYEVIVVDDGSMDNTQAILARFPNVRTIRQVNRGLSCARNVGLRAATGSIIAYTDSDCFADRDWLTLLVYQLQRSGAAAVGGPNLPPEDGRIAACVAASPGQPTHVLENDQTAEHIPGCNMAFRREALETVGGFDPQYRKAGDDVDMCWRLQQAGMWITFAPSAFVWHHRRQSPRAYFKQQAGYGEAEALLRFKHPDHFNGRGDGKWRGVLYGPSLWGLRLARPIIYHGTFGTALFQTLYQPGPAHWAMLPSTLEWHLAMALAALLALFWKGMGLIALAMLALSLLGAALQATQARLPAKHDGLRSRFLVMALCYAQPLVRSLQRYQTRLLAQGPPMAPPGIPKEPGPRLPLIGTRTATYWTEEGHERTELLGLVIAYLAEQRWDKTIDSGWSDWDLEVFCHSWTIIQLSTVEENHGSGKRLIRVRYRLRPSGYMKTLVIATIFAAIAAVGLLAWPGVVEAALLVAVGCGTGLACAVLWWRGTCLAAHIVGAVDALAREMGLLPLYGDGKVKAEKEDKAPISLSLSSLHSPP